MTEREIIYHRLYVQGLSTSDIDHPADVVRRLGAVQAQEYGPSLWALAVRTKGCTEADVERALEERTIVRTWPMRGTLHYVPAEDARWMLELLAPRAIRKAAPYYRSEGLEEADFKRSKDVFVNQLRDGKTCTRKELYTALEDAGISVRGQRGMHIVTRLAQEGLICFGPRRGKQPTLVLLDEWVPGARKLAGDEALAELATRYFRGHGPAGAADFAWWTGLSMGEARRTMDMLGADLHRIELGGRQYGLFSLEESVPNPEPPVHLLPVFDEYTVAYQDRSLVINPGYMKQTGNGIFFPTIVQDGLVVGTWKPDRRKADVVIQLDLFEPEHSVRSEYLSAAVERYRRFTGLPVV